MNRQSTDRHHPLYDRSGAPQVEALIRDGARILRACQLEYSPRWLQRMARTYRHNGHWRRSHFAYFLADRMALSQQEMHSFLAYADPTGEQAVRNVMARA